MVWKLTHPYLSAKHEAALRQSAHSVDGMLLKAMASVTSKAEDLKDELQSSLDLAQASREQQAQAFDASRNELHHLADALAALRDIATNTESSLAARVDLLAHVVSQQAEQAHEFKGIISSLAEMLKAQKELLDTSRARGGWWNNALFGLLGIGPARGSGVSTLGSSEAAWEDRVLSAVERIARTGEYLPLEKYRAEAKVYARLAHRLASSRDTCLGWTGTRLCSARCYLQCSALTSRRRLLPSLLPRESTQSASADGRFS